MDQVARVSDTDRGGSGSSKILLPPPGYYRIPGENDFNPSVVSQEIMISLALGWLDG